MTTHIRSMVPEWHGIWNFQTMGRSINKNTQALTNRRRPKIQMSSLAQSAECHTNNKIPMDYKDDPQLALTAWTSDLRTLTVSGTNSWKCELFNRVDQLRRGVEGVTRNPKTPNQPLTLNPQTSTQNRTRRSTTHTTDPTTTKPTWRWQRKTGKDHCVCSDTGSCLAQTRTANALQSVPSTAWHTVAHVARF